jgi:hypothetical protein
MTDVIHATHLRALYAFVVAEDLKPQHICQASFWARFPKLRVGDRVEFAPASGSWFAEVVVIEAGPKVELLRFVSFRPSLWKRMVRAVRLLFRWSWEAS